jgi:hypothetical protein
VNRASASVRRLRGNTAAVIGLWLSVAGCGVVRALVLRHAVFVVPHVLGRRVLADS